jgi:hypothetical protein
VASPTLWPHGFVLALPALLGAPSAALAWAGLGLGTLDNVGPWLLTALAGAILVTRTWDGQPVDADPTHPFAGRAGPWASASPSATTPLSIDTMSRGVPILRLPGGGQRLPWNDTRSRLSAKRAKGDPTDSSTPPRS